MSVKNIASAARGWAACFFGQTFRRHTGGEYCEFFTRGLRPARGVQRAYPWFYIRLFAACVILFAVYLLIVRFTSGGMFVPVTVTVAALAFNLPFLVLLYEIYPRDDLSLLSVFVALLAGGTGACVLAQVLYGVIPSAAGCLGALRAGGVEEFAKSAAVIVILASLRVKRPMTGLIFGAAVGCGFSIVEDAGYVFTGAENLSFLNISAAVSLFIDRGLSALCTHTVWSAAVGWCFAARGRTFAWLRTCAGVICAFLLHSLWDMPFPSPYNHFATSLCAVAAAAFGVAALTCGRRALFAEEGLASSPEFYRADGDSLVKDRRYYIHAGHLSLTFGAFAMAVIAIIYCSLPFRETYYAQSFSSPEDFVAFMQCDLPLSDRFEREYDPSAAVCEDEVVSGVLTSVTQCVNIRGYEYYYKYSVYTLSGESAYILSSVGVEITQGGVTARRFAESVYDREGNLYARYFRVRTDVSGVNMSNDGVATAILYDSSFTYDYSRPRYVVLFVALGVFAAASLVLYIKFYIQARRLKNA